jgi:RNA polymerase sigma factor (TIGR02999 family)
MDSASPRGVTELLQAWRLGNASALDELLPLVYAELRRRARRYVARERRSLTLQSTDLIHEVYLKLVRAKPVDWRDRSHFFALSARLMRQVLVDHARSRAYAKRENGARRVTFDDGLAWDRADADLVGLDEALQALAAADPRKSQVVELRFFGGLSVEEAAEVLGVSRQTVIRDWRLSRAWLLRELSRRGQDEGTRALGQG